MISTQEPPGPEAPGRDGAPGRLAAIPRVLALVSGVFAAACLVWSVLPGLSGALRVPRDHLDQYYLHAPATNLLWAAAAGLLAVGLSRRKRVAWWAALLYQVSWLPVNLLDIVREQNPNAALGLLVHLGVFALLITARAQFTARVRPCSPRPAATTFAAGSVAAGVAGACVVQMFPGSSAPGAPRALFVVSQLTAGLAVRPAQFTEDAPFSTAFLLGLFGAMVFAATVMVLVRTQRAEHALTEADETALRELLNSPDSTGSIDYLATRRDRGIVFSPNGRAAIGYRVESGICLALGDPLGARDCWPQAVAAWQRYARRFGWPVAVVGAGDAAVPVYRRAGLDAVAAGAEALLDTRTFALTTPELRPVRDTLTRLRKQGVTVRIRRHRDIGTAEFARLAVTAEQWRRTETERAYPLPLGRFGDRRDGDCLLVEAVDAEDRVLGILSLVPWGRTGATLELLRREPGTTEEITDLLIAEFALRAEQHGIEQVSLNFTVSRSVFEAAGRRGRPGPGRGIRAVAVAMRDGVRGLPLAFSHWWQLDQLYRAATRCQPRWSTRYVMSADPRHLPRIAVAVAVAEGLLPRPGAGAGAFTHTGRHRAVPEGAPAATPVAATAAAAVAAPEQDLRPEQVRVRTGKLDRLAGANIDPYPPPFPPTHTVAAARRVPRGTTVRISGRLLRLRDCGGVLFAVIRDWTSDIQLLLDRERLGAARCAEFGELFDLGDLISVSGQLGYSRRGELSLLVADWRMLAKCLHPLPDKWHGLTDPDARMRRGYLDLMIDREARELLARRSAVLRALRDALHDGGFLEVGSPVLQAGPGTGTARSMRTHIDADNTDLHLRLGPEAALKRLCVGGVEKVFELGPSFRNARTSARHLPEFTQLEAYEAHGDQQRMMTLCRHLVQQAALAANDSMVAMRPRPDGSLAALDLSGEWRVRSFYEALAQETGTEVTPDTGLPELRDLCEKADISCQPSWDHGRAVYALYRRLVAETTYEPTFYTDFPGTVSPLARSHRRRAGVAERWDLVAGGIELGSGRSELTDPVELRRRFTAQARANADGGPAITGLDEELLCALEHGMPPTGGLSLGVERVLMLLTGRTIRETQTFPLVRQR
ncbi:bifunctional lysylphosphatidylglycerol synthetase/lysine--tRNA ligase LysX [Nocardia carnea]|uniref:bifunctional lysylphosphatidylglycerol synthetase/lysine--tRNA ligase LysX n=1 Tax=Nocardia carnea TaxID=37328 RepID=UPI0024557E3E|nr:bifunctional lysylphosphatidylglycerol synthetase/lysine--tRNA ligase LysX [Nocardia carnea]